jgi:hypothetical protein
VIRVLSLVIAACVATGGHGAQFRSSTSAVPVHVTVMDGRQPLTGLVSGDFALTDAGVAQQVSAIDAASESVDLSLVLPDSSNLAGGDEALFRSEVDAVRGLLRADDRLRLIAAGADVTELGSNVKASGSPAGLISRSYCYPLFDALATLLIQSRSTDRRHIVLALTRSSGTGSVTDETALSELARRSSAQLFVYVEGFKEGYETRRWSLTPWCAPAVYDWDPSRRQRLQTIANMRDPLERARALSEYEHERLTRVAQLTGGSGIRPSLVSGSITGAVQRVLEVARTGYILYYTPTGVPASGWHPIEVTVTRPGKFEVNARPGYSR